jgi:predicted ABC-type ATPase
LKNKTKKPSLYVIAGPNGSGKTTFAREFLPHDVKCMEFVNVDLIAGGISPFAPERAAIRAGRLMLEQIHSLGNRGADFGFETTLSGKTYIKLFNDLKKKDWINRLFSLCSMRFALCRKTVFKDGAASNGKIFVSYGLKKVLRRN